MRRAPRLWILDALFICVHKEAGFEFSDVDGIVLIGNNQTCKIRGIVSVLLRVGDGSVKMLSDVRDIPQVKRNLISLGTLKKKGYTFTSTNGEMKVLKDS